MKIIDIIPQKIIKEIIMTLNAEYGIIKARNNQQNDATTPSCICSWRQNPPKKGKKTTNTRRKIKFGLGLKMIRDKGKKLRK